MILPILIYPKAFMAWCLCTVVLLFILEFSLNNELSRPAFYGIIFIKESDRSSFPLYSVITQRHLNRAYILFFAGSTAPLGSGL
jgi:hypothetical protein